MREDQRLIRYQYPHKNPQIQKPKKMILLLLLVKRMVLFAALLAPTTSACAPVFVQDPSTDQVCENGCTCMYNMTSYKSISNTLQIKIEVNAHAQLNFGFPSSGSDWTVQSSGIAEVNCAATSSCTDIRLLGEGITGKCTGVSSCINADCEGLSSKIVGCTATSACIGSKGCLAPCSITDGSSANSESCACGFSDCTAGFNQLFCLSATNTCCRAPCSMVHPCPPYQMASHNATTNP